MTPSAIAHPQELTHMETSRHLRLIVAVVLGMASATASFVPALHSGELRWVPLVLAIPLVTWCAWPIHAAAGRSLLSGRPTPDVLATAGILASVAWAAHAIVSDAASTRVLPVALATLLMVAADNVSSAAETVEPYDTSPRWLTPLVLVVAAATMATWWTTDGADPASSAALSALLVAAPGALRLAGPAAHLVGSRRGAAAGIFLGDPAALATAQRITAIVLDKDGTVTTGELSVSAVDPVETEHLRNLRWFAGALAHCSEEPVARAISKLSGRGRVSQLALAPGQGLSGSVDRHPVRVGLPTWIGVEAVEGLGQQVAVEVDGRFLGRITVADTIRPDARVGVDRLRELGLEPVLVSERGEADTADLAQRTGIASTHAGATALAREQVVRQLQADGHVVAMAGDLGPNTEALNAADLIFTSSDGPADRGIAVTEVDVTTVANAVSLARSVDSTARTNRRWAVAGMIAPLPLAATGLLSPVLAPVVALACMIAVGVNSLRIQPPATRGVG